MTPNFNVKYGGTVSSDYSWDYGTPAITGIMVANQVPSVIDGLIYGYAPGTSITVENSSAPPFTPTTLLTSVSTLFVWNFGDFYNDKTNIFAASCVENVEHVYIMPGKYEITLTTYETVKEKIPDPRRLSRSRIVTRVITETIKKPVCVVNEILPVAGLYSVTQPSTGPAPMLFQLTARTTKPGSFPIDKIVWNFGDGSPLLTVSRYATATNSALTDVLLHTNIFSQDFADPRNYDVFHTYYRTDNIYPVFYPSITAYSSSTGTFDACSITIGPLSLPSIETLKIIKNKITPNGSFYIAQQQNNIAFFKTSTETTIPIVTVQQPTAPIRSSYHQSVVSSGYPGTNYYSIQNVEC